VELAGRDPRVVAITAAMPDGSGLVKFRETFPDRYIDVGINESHAVAMAAGLARSGMRPIVAIYSTFLQRAFDQIFQEVVLQNLPVLFCMDRAGLVGSDGAVHHGFADIAMLRILPGMVLMAPADAEEFHSAMALGLSLDGPAAIRYPRDEVPDALPGSCPAFAMGQAREIRSGRDGSILCYGTMGEPALVASDRLREQENLDIAVLNARFAKPLDAAQITRRIASGRPVLVCEDHSIAGGFGAAVTELAASRGLDLRNVRLAGIPDRFIAHAPRQEQQAETGLDATGLAAMMQEMIHHIQDVKQYL